MSSDMDWTPEIVQRLRTLWADGLSTAAIGRRLGVSKNAIVGKAHRLDLPARPSPIRRDARPRQARVRRAPVAMTSFVSELPETPVTTAPQELAFKTGAPLRPRADRFACCWPIGHPGRPGFRSCGEQIVPGRPYCAKHCEVAYVKGSGRHRRREHADAIR